MAVGNRSPWCATRKVCAVKSEPRNVSTGRLTSGARGTTNTATLTADAACCFRDSKARRSWCGPWLFFSLFCGGLGLVTSYTMGGFIHLLLVFAVIAVLVRVIQGPSAHLILWSGLRQIRSDSGGERR